MDWFPWHYERYRLKTRHLTAEQDGIYRRLIDEYMETRQPLPNDDLALAGIARVDFACFSSASSTVRAFFYVKKKGLLNHKTCDEMLDDQDSLSTFRSERAKKAAFARHNKPNKIKTKPATSKPIALLGDATITVNNNSKQLSKDNIIKPDGVSEDLWMDFVALRKAKKAPITKTAIQAIIREAGKAYIPLEKAIEITIERNWIGFKSDWLKPEERKALIVPKKQIDVVEEFGFEF